MPNDPPSKSQNTPPPQEALTLDLEKYLAQLSEWEISETQKTEFIATLWQLLLSFAELGFEIHPAQDAQKDNAKSARKLIEDSTEKTPITQEKPGVSSGGMLHSTHINRTQTIGPGGQDVAPQGEGVEG